MEKSALTRRHFTAAMIAAGVLSWPRRVSAFAGGESLPPPLQAKFLSKVAKYDRNFETRAGGTAKVLLVQKSGNGTSESAASKLEHALETIGKLAGIPTKVAIVNYKGPADLGSMVASGGLAVVYIMPGLHNAVASMAAALDGQNVLSVAASPDDVTEGTALGFALEEGKPKILVNLDAAKAQGVDFRSSLLKVARVV